MEFHLIKLDQIEECNVIIGMAHFIKTVEDLYEALVTSVPNIMFGLAFCEASGPCLVRYDGTDDQLSNSAKNMALKIACGHCFIIYLRNAYPINVLEKIKQVSEVCTIYAASANPLEVIIAETQQGRSVLGIVDGYPSKGIETDKDIIHRKAFLRKIGYKR